VEVNLSKKCEIEFHDLAALVQKLPADLGVDVLLVADAPVDVPESDHALRVTPGSGPESWRALGTLSLA